jgi:tRNA dimethylallyltransferase
VTHDGALEKPTGGLLSAAIRDPMRAPHPLSPFVVVEPVDDIRPLLAIVGPTAAGKSALALAIAEETGGEILNYDSVQVYRGFNIGSGKVPIEERRGIAHHLLDVVDPDQAFAAGDYRRKAQQVLGALRARACFPILVGGTGLYLRSLLQGLFDGPARSEALRARLRKMAARRRPRFLYRLLIRLDTASALRIHPHDEQKLIRAIEVCLLARQPMSAMFNQGRVGLQGFRMFKLGLNPPRGELHERINRRVEEMYRRGLLEEVRVALARPDSARLKPLEALGYAQACAALRGEQTVEEAIRQTQTATRQYAKRQMTWFRREQGVTWFTRFGDDRDVQRQAVEWFRRNAAPPCLASRS